MDYDLEDFCIDARRLKQSGQLSQYVFFARREAGNTQTSLSLCNPRRSARCLENGCTVAFMTLYSREEETRLDSESLSAAY